MPFRNLDNILYGKINIKEKGQHPLAPSSAQRGADQELGRRDGGEERPEAEGAPPPVRGQPGPRLDPEAGTHRGRRGGRQEGGGEALQ